MAWDVVEQARARAIHGSLKRFKLRFEKTGLNSDRNISLKRVATVRTLAVLYISSNFERRRSYACLNHSLLSSTSGILIVFEYG